MHCNPPGSPRVGSPFVKYRRTPHIWREDRLRSAARPPAHQEVLERLEVGDDAVVDHHKLVRGVRDVRVRVGRGGRAVRGPARVRDACAAQRRAAWSARSSASGLPLLPPLSCCTPEPRDFSLPFSLRRLQPPAALCPQMLAALLRLCCASCPQARAGQRRPRWPGHPPAPQDPLPACAPPKTPAGLPPNHTRCPPPCPAPPRPPTRVRLEQGVKVQRVLGQLQIGQLLQLGNLARGLHHQGRGCGREGGGGREAAEC